MRFHLRQNVMKFAELTQEVQIAKVQINKPDVGLMPGRRMANLQIKESIKSGIQAMGLILVLLALIMIMQKKTYDYYLLSDDLVNILKSVVYSLGPAFPSLLVGGLIDIFFCVDQICFVNISLLKCYNVIIIKIYLLQLAFAYIYIYNNNRRIT